MIDQIEVVALRWAFRLIEILFGNLLARRDALAKVREEAAAEKARAVAKAREEARAECIRQLYFILGFGAAVFLIFIFLKSLPSAARA